MFDLHALAPWMLVPIFLGATPVEALTLSSPAFKDRAPIPTKYAYHGEGQNLSIPYMWKTPPKGTQSFVLVLYDPHPVAKNWIHWAVIDIPATVHELPEGTSTGPKMPGQELTNSFGEKGYGGPMPPPGSGTHPYRAVLFALNSKTLAVPRKPSLQDIEKALKGKVLAQASYEGTYQRP